MRHTVTANEGCFRPTVGATIGRQPIQSDGRPRLLTNQKYICATALSFTSLTEGDGDGNAERFQ